MATHYVAQAGFKLSIRCLRLLSAGVTGVGNHTLRLRFAVLRPSQCLHCVSNET